MRILKRYPATRRSRPMAIVRMGDRHLELRYLFVTEEDRAVYSHLAETDPWSYVTVRAGTGLTCRRGVRCKVTGRVPNGTIPRTVDLPLDGDPTDTFDRFLQDLEARLAEAVL